MLTSSFEPSTREGTLDYEWNTNNLFATINNDFHKIFVTDFDAITLGWKI